MLLDDRLEIELDSGAEVASILAVGDLCPIGRVEEGMLNFGAEALISREILELMRSDTYTIINLEAPLCSHERPIAKTGPNFISSPRIAEILKNAGVDAAGLANNHILDQDLQGLEETMFTLEGAGIDWFGALLEPGDEWPLLIPFESHPAESPGNGTTRVCVLNIAEGEFGASGSGAAASAAVPTGGAVPFDIPAVCRCIETQTGRGFHTVIYAHAGNEYQPFPGPFHQNAYRRFIDSGACAVIAHHPHIPQGVEVYRHGVIVYSLGNFLFDYGGHAGKPCTRSGYLTRIGFSNSGIANLKLYPYFINDNCRVELHGETGRQRFYEYMRTVSAPLDDSAQVAKLWEQEIIRSFGPTYSWLMIRAADEMRDAGRLDGAMASAWFNLFRCEAHAAALTTAFRLMHERKFEIDPEISNLIDSAFRQIDVLKNGNNIHEE